MIYPHREVRDQSALDVADHLLRCQLRRRQYVNLIYRPAVPSNDSRGDHTGKRQDQFFSALDWEYAAGDRRRQGVTRCRSNDLTRLRTGSNIGSHILLINTKILFT